jgi:ataxin-10
MVTVLEFCSQSFAQSPKSRIEAGTDPLLWTDLRKLWRDLSRTFSSSFWDADDEDDSSEEDAEQNKNEGGPSNLVAKQKRQKRKSDEQAQDIALKVLCASVAKFTRNLVAGVRDNQVKAFENEPDIRRLLHYYTSFSAMEDSDSIVAARLLTQALSNVVTANEALVEKLWVSYMKMPEDEVVLIRLLGSRDPKTLLTTLIFVLNCVHRNRKRTHLLVKSKVGVRICIHLLDNMVNLHEAEEGSEGAKAFDIGHVSFLGLKFSRARLKWVLCLCLWINRYALVTQLIEDGFAPDLYRKFTM